MRTVHLLLAGALLASCCLLFAEGEFPTGGRHDPEVFLHSCCSVVMLHCHAVAAHHSSRRVHCRPLARYASCRRARPGALTRAQEEAGLDLSAVNWNDPKVQAFTKQVDATHAAILSMSSGRLASPGPGSPGTGNNGLATAGADQTSPPAGATIAAASVIRRPPPSRTG